MRHYLKNILLFHSSCAFVLLLLDRLRLSVITSEGNVMVIHQRPTREIRQ